MKVQAKLFANFSAYLPPGSAGFSCQLDLEEGARIIDLLGRLQIPEEAAKIVLLNQGPGRPEDVLKDGDVVGVFPPVAGG
jgi:molybdopterin synthase sulfur carrier subunit